MNTVEITLEKRAALGKKECNRLRREGIVPGVIYGGEEVIHFKAPKSAFKPLIYTPDFKVAAVTLDGQSMRCILKEVQFHPITDEVVHIDFIQLVDGKKVKVDLPVRFKGNSPGVRAGGKLVQQMRRVKVLTTPEALVDELLIDISPLEMSQSARVRDIDTPDGLDIMTAPATPIVTVMVPRSMRSAATAEAKAAKKAGSAEEAPVEEAAE